MACGPDAVVALTGDVWEEFDAHWCGTASLPSEICVDVFDICKKMCVLRGYRGFSFGGQKCYFVKMDTSVERCVEALEEGNTTKVYTVLQGQGWEVFPSAWCTLVDWSLESVDSWNLIPALKKICSLQGFRGLCVHGGSAYFIPAEASAQECREAMVPSSRFGGGHYVVASMAYLRV